MNLQLNKTANRKVSSCACWRVKEIRGHQKRSVRREGKPQRVQCPRNPEPKEREAPREESIQLWQMRPTVSGMSAENRPLNPATWRTLVTVAKTVQRSRWTISVEATRSWHGCSGKQSGNMEQDSYKYSYL